MNPTIEKFGYPATLVHEYAHWLVLLRPAQPTLGCLVLTAKSHEVAFGALSAEAFAELATVTADIERVLVEFVGFEKINYLMLMMVDPHVHFHVIPRYHDERTWDGIAFPDAGWPRPPELSAAKALNQSQIHALTRELGKRW